MKRALSFIGGFLIGALIFGIAGSFLGYELANSGEPVVIVRNLTHSTIPHVSIATDVGETHTIDNLSPNESRHIRISKREKSLWIVATTSTGETKKSEQIYVSSEGTVFVVVSEDVVTIDYGL